MVPASLRTWFLIHFIADILFAVPLFLAPVQTLQLFGWATIDPLATRLVASAFFAIGTTSLFVRHSDRSSFQSLLLLKQLWSGAAIVGLVWSLSQGAPPFAYVALAIFLVFASVWSYYAHRLRF